MEENQEVKTGASIVQALNRGKEPFILGAILLLGLLLRIYNINFPSIGYHNMKENEYLSMAQAMKDGEDFITRRIYFYDAFNENPKMRIYPQVPLISYQILISWKILGENLWGARLFNIIFGVLSILVIYFISQVLFRKKMLSLFCAFLLAIMPLAVFFSRNIQPESPAFFFMLLGNLFYLRFASSLKKYNLFLGGLSFSLAWLYKVSFVFGMLPFIFCMPFRTLWKEKKELFKCVIIFSAPYLVILIAFLWFKYIGQWEFQELGRVKIGEILTLAYWKKYGRMIWWYARGENFTWVYTISALLGIALACTRRKGLLNRYIIGWTLTIIPYSLVFSDYINQHNYYQLPFLAMVCISTVYIISGISETIKKFLQKSLLIYIMIITAGISVPFVFNSISRMHATVFLGVDVAGESLKEFTKPDERIFLNTYAQGFGIARYARRYMG